MDWDDDILSPIPPEDFQSLRLIFNGLGHMGMRGFFTAIFLAIQGI